MSRNRHPWISRGPIFSSIATSACALLFCAGPASAENYLYISTNPTNNVTCTNNVCEVPGRTGNLNVTQLENMLAVANVTLNSETLFVRTAVSWVSANTLTLNGGAGNFINAPISVAGTGGLVIGNGGVAFGLKGRITFWSTSDTLEIAGTSYTLVNSITGLASAAAENPNANYALAGNYNASADGTYHATPIAQANLLGLNNTISNLTIVDRTSGDAVGLFGGGQISNLTLHHVRVSGADHSQVGGLVGVNNGSLVSVSVDGIISTGRGIGSVAGGIAGVNNSGISAAVVSGRVSGGVGAIVGGVAGEDVTDGVHNVGGVAGSYSTASVSIAAGNCPRCAIGSAPNSAGGVVGVNNGVVDFSFATGSVTGGTAANLGGLVGLAVSGASNDISHCYSTGSVTGGSGSSIGGSIGYDQTAGEANYYIYWDTTSSGISNASQGAGNIANDSGITGLTTVQLQSGLPPGFESNAWVQNPKVNDGFPYLRGLPGPR